jgi:hypothetical protein
MSTKATTGSELIVETAGCDSAGGSGACPERERSDPSAASRSSSRRRFASGDPTELANTKSSSPEYGLARRCSASIFARLGGIGTSRRAAHFRSQTRPPRGISPVPGPLPSGRRSGFGTSSVLVPGARRIARKRAGFCVGCGASRQGFVLAQPSGKPASRPVSLVVTLDQEVGFESLPRSLGKRRSGVAFFVAAGDSGSAARQCSCRFVPIHETVPGSRRRRR